MPDRGEVWWGPAPFKSSAARPWLVISDERRPFSHAECIALAMTTQEYTEGIAVLDEAWIEGRADVQSYISPWFVTTIKLREFHDQQGPLTPDLVTQAVEALHGYTPATVD
jgi:mRNA-degrading endonuclease toxin of MazEF toxin-antitoxin module